MHPVLHKDYIDSLCQDVYEKLSDLIADAAAECKAKKVETPPLYNEVLIHWRKAALRGQDCQGKIILNGLRGQQLYLWNLLQIGCRKRQRA